MSEPLDELYLKWLYNEISSIETTRPPRTYWHLLKHMFKKEFIWFVPNDDNRAEDGKALRDTFLQSQRIYDEDPFWLHEACSVLEMVVTVANKLEFVTDEPADHWFWRLISNLKLSQYTDRSYNGKEVEDILDQLIWRTYDYNGSGGLFPLENPEEDQKDVEIWYQLNSYLLEMS